MSVVKRIFVEKKLGYDVEAQRLYKEFKELVGVDGLESVRVINRYDIESHDMQMLDEDVYCRAKWTILADPVTDHVYEEKVDLFSAKHYFIVSAVEGQYDQRADMIARNLQLMAYIEPPLVQTAKLIVLDGDVTDADLAKIKAYYINPVELRELSAAKPFTLHKDHAIPGPVEVIENFIHLNENGLIDFLADRGLAMTLADLRHIQRYFREEEDRDPTITELKLIDTYWSDHCRHTTFMTKITDVSFEDNPAVNPITDAYDAYLALREATYGEGTDRDITMMDMAVIAMKYMRKEGMLDDLDVSEEVNACSIEIKADINGQEEDWLLMFKNETHNHPTEIEPFGGAGTCLGGGIRDPLSGRSYIYQAMRVTGAADPRTPIDQTLEGKLPQIKITRDAANGYSAYGNQIGVAGGYLVEKYHPNFVAKRMEVGALMAAAPKVNVVREEPQPGDVVLLVGGKTGRDGLGGAVGSSKEHDEDSVADGGAEVQKGDPLLERHIIRLFRNPEAAQMIKRCNDFGAGGVSVAIGELCDGLMVNLDAVPLKYEGMDGTEIALSESQERMAVVVAAEDVAKFAALAEAENLEVANVADVSANRRLTMVWRGHAIVDISRDFLDTNGIQQETKVFVQGPNYEESYFAYDKYNEATVEANILESVWLDNLRDLNIASQAGLASQFDSTSGGDTVLAQYGGKYQTSPAEGMVAKIPVLSGDTTTVSMMTMGYDPDLASWSPFHGAMYAVVESIAKIVAMGGDYRKTRLSFQEYFEKLGKDPKKWGKPFSALMGALYAQLEFETPAIGGKDSMSGSFLDIDVPPTLISFAVNVTEIDKVISADLKAADSKVFILGAGRDGDEVIDFAGLRSNYLKIRELAEVGQIRSAKSVTAGGIAAAMTQMALGNRIGVKVTNDVLIRTPSAWFARDYGSILIEMDASLDHDQLLAGVTYMEIGHTIDRPVIDITGLELDLAELEAAWMSPLADIFPVNDEHRLLDEGELEEGSLAIDFVNPVDKGIIQRTGDKVSEPKVIIPLIPGVTGEYETARAFTNAGASVETVVIQNFRNFELERSIDKLIQAIESAQILCLAGGMAGADEPDGTAKSYQALFANPKLRAATLDLVNKRDGLILGLGNGFQALVKLGLLPYGCFCDQTEESMTFARNSLDRFIATQVQTKITAKASPWFNKLEVGQVYSLPVASGAGKLIMSKAIYDDLAEKGQIASQYLVDPFASKYGVEAMTSPDGKILGKMGHSERTGAGRLINLAGKQNQDIFTAAVEYFTK